MKVLLVAPQTDLFLAAEEVQDILRSGLAVTPLLGHLTSTQRLQEQANIDVICMLTAVPDRQAYQTGSLLASAPPSRASISHRMIAPRATERRGTAQLPSPLLFGSRSPCPPREREPKLRPSGRVFLETLQKGRTRMSEQVEVTDGRVRPFYMLDNALIAIYGAQIGVYGIAVYNVLAYYANRQQQAWPSYQTIADQLGISRTKVVETIKQLIACGLLQKAHLFSSTGDQSSNHYLLLSLPEPPSTQHEPPSQQDTLPSTPHVPSGTQHAPPGTQHALPSTQHVPPSTRREHEQYPMNKIYEQDPMNKIHEQDPTHQPPASVALRATGGSGSRPKEESEEKAEKAEKEKAQAHPATHAILHAYLDALDYTPANLGQEARAAKQLAQAGYAPHDITAAYELLKAQDFRQLKHLSLQTVFKEIPAIHHALLKGARSKTHAGHRHDTRHDTRFAGQGGPRYAASESEAKIGEQYRDANGQIHTRLDPELKRRIDERRARLRAEGNLCFPGAHLLADSAAADPAAHRL
jgi:hypothetical protein